MIKELVQKKDLYNFDQLKEIAAGSDDFMRMLVEIFIKTTPADSAEMLHAVKAGEWQKVSKYAHKMKSTIDSLNMISIKSDIRTLELDAKNKANTASLPALAAKVDSVIAEVTRQIRAEYNL